MKARILIVDDERSLREMISSGLDKEDYEVKKAEDAMSAIDMLRTEPFNVVVTDKNMPGTQHKNEGGLDVLQFAKASNPACGVLMMTGYASIESAIEAMRLGAFDYISKPFGINELREKIARIISYQRVMNPGDTLAAYEHFWSEYLAAVEEDPDVKACLSQEKNAHLLTTLQQNLDLFFQERKTRENVLLEQREALSKIAFLASQIRDLLPNDDSEASVLLNALLAETEHRL
jgi:DNA-binding response OmpR family regulator